jgi:hypothetical protein
MVRYLSQPVNTNICGPVAIINIMKFFGFNATSRHLSFVKYKCEYENGVDSSGVTAALRDIDKLKFFIRNNPTIEAIDGHLDNGGAVLLITAVKEDEEFFGHCWIITEKNTKDYVSHNYNYKSKESLTKEELEKSLKYIYDDMPKAWFVSQR